MSAPDSSSLDSIEHCLASNWLSGTVLARDANPGEYAMRAALVADVTDALPASEQRAAEPFAPRRRATFSTGRQCARAALAAIGQAQVSLERLTSGAVRWPVGVLGSISHTDKLAIAIAAQSGAGGNDGQALLSVGIDVEQQRSLEPDVIDMVTTVAERQWLTGRPDWQALALFSARESIYKCLYPLVHRFIDFDAVTIHDLDAAVQLVELADGQPVLDLALELHDEELAARVSAHRLCLRLAVLPAEVLTIAILTRRLTGNS